MHNNEITRKKKFVLLFKTTFIVNGLNFAWKLSLFVVLRNFFKFQNVQKQTFSKLNSYQSMLTRRFSFDVKIAEIHQVLNDYLKFLRYLLKN